jgi:high-affinity nickel-transport protein
VFESVVGGTLVALGVVVLWQLARDRGRYRYVGRVMLLTGALRRARRGDAGGEVGRRSAFAVGVLHGAGAETPTQVVLFASAGAAGSKSGAVLVLLAFVAGLVASDVGFAIAWLGSIVGARRVPAAQIAFGVLTGCSSLAIGVLFLAGRPGVLPALLSG